MENAENVRPIAENIYDECKENGLTIKDFLTLVGLLSTKADEIKKTYELKMLAEKLQ